MDSHSHTLCVMLAVIVMLTGTVSGQRFKREVVDLFAMIEDTAPEVVTEADLANLPSPVQRYLRYTGVVGMERIRAVRLRQQGFMRIKEGGPWLPLKAVQYYTTDPPAFLWRGSVKPMPLLWVTARDRYRGGRGNMVIRLLGLFKIADARAPELDQGTLLRYLNEGMWFPTVYLEDYIRWEAIDSVSARATMSFGGVTASAVLHIDELGQLTNFVAERYMEEKGEYRLETWSTPIDEYAELNGIMIPISGRAVWHLESGDFPYIQVDITDIEYGVPVPY